MIRLALLRLSAPSIVGLLSVCTLAFFALNISILFYDFTIPKLQEDRFFCISLNLHVPSNTVLKFLNQIRKWPNKFKIHFILDLLGLFISTFIFKFFHEDQWGVAGTGA